MSLTIRSNSQTSDGHPIPTDPEYLATITSLKFEKAKYDLKTAGKILTFMRNLIELEFHGKIDLSSELSVEPVHFTNLRKVTLNGTGFGKLLSIINVSKLEFFKLSIPKPDSTSKLLIEELESDVRKFLKNTTVVSLALSRIPMIALWRTQGLKKLEELIIKKTSGYTREVIDSLKDNYSRKIVFRNLKKLDIYVDMDDVEVDEISLMIKSRITKNESTLTYIKFLFSRTLNIAEQSVITELGNYIKGKFPNVTLGVANFSD
ncbi:hypothetical protein BDQ17DRAFT_1329718 [Cyathus striatus]|nr:hypothetical protein BDQ17DRAFT_1329718 [Cyathus striatus]